MAVCIEYLERWVTGLGSWWEGLFVLHCKGFDWGGRSPRKQVS
jgi:hypothetical protein